MRAIKKLVRTAANRCGYDIVGIPEFARNFNAKKYLETLPKLEQINALGLRENYFIQDGYTCQEKLFPYDDRGAKDGSQREVYEFAKSLCDREHLTRVCDVGCGSAYKLLRYFGHLETLGLELSPTYEWLCTKYPKRNWAKSDLSANFEHKTDLVISADVVEHLLDPNVLMDTIKSIECQFIVLSTPDRNLIRNSPYLGPPSWQYHIREWSFAEFEKYVGGYFNIVEHFISAPAQGTQCILCTPR